MNTQNLAIETIFNAAKALPPESRTAYLNLACREDAALRREVERLLGAAAGADGFFEAKPAGLTQLGNTVVDAAVREGPGTKIGRYKLLQQIGEGGMGVVYMAEQEEPVRRRVALKIIKLGMDTQQVVARFEAERQALAMMDHPSIAKIYDAGTTGEKAEGRRPSAEGGESTAPRPDHRLLHSAFNLLPSGSGRPYFVMELVQGVSIIEFCDKARLSAKERLDLFLQVCEAVQSAHQKGIIHRDLKPSNILVTQHQGKPMPKVIDFGIAKATNQKLTEKTLFTQHATMIGTPAYMSPEQAEMSSMDVDTRSDIYSLGVLLYELLTGSTPFPEKRLRSLGYGEMQRVIAEEEPERPSARLSTLGQEQKTVLARNRGEELATLNSRLRGDLDWIVMKCLEKDRTRRYDTANGLAADLKRHLDNEPVVARPPSLGYRVQKTVRRHRSAFATAGVVLVALLLGLGISVWQAVQKSRALARMTEAEQAQAYSREVAEKALNQEAAARQRVDELLERETAARRAGEARLYATDIHLAQQAIDKDNFDRARELLARHYPRPGETNRPGWEYRYLWQQLQDDAAFEVGRITHNEGLAVGSSTSPDNRWLVAAHQSDDRAWIDVMDITHLRALRKAGEIVMPSANIISKIAVGDRNGLIAHAQASTTLRALGPGAMTTIGIHEATTRRTLATITNLPGLCMDLAWSGDSQHLLTQTALASPSGSTIEYRSRIDVWRAPDLTHVTTLTNFPKLSASDINLGIAVTADASAVAVASRSCPLSVIDVASGATRWSLTSQYRGFVEIALTSDGRTLFAVEDADPWVIRVFDFLTGKELCPPLRDSDRGNWGGLILSPDGRTLASTSSKGFLCFWEVGDPTHGPKALPRLRSPSVGGFLALLPDGRTALTYSGNGTVLAWDLARERPSRRPLKVTIQNDFANYQLGADNRTLLIAARDGAVIQRHGPEFQSETPLFNLGRRLGQPVFSEDGRWFAAGSTNGFVEVWNVLERRRVQQFGQYPGSVRAEQFSEDGTRLIVLDRAHLRYVEWDWAAPREGRTFPALMSGKDPYQRPGILSRGGHQVLTATGGGDLTWMDTQSQEKRSGHLGSTLEGGLKFAPGAGRFAATPVNGYAHIYDSRTFKRIATLGDGMGAPASLAFLDGGDRVLLGGFRLKSPVALWDTATQLELLRLGAEGDVVGLQVSLDGSVLTGYSSLDSGKEIHLWRAPSWEEIERAEAALASVSAARPR